MKHCMRCLFAIFFLTGASAFAAPAASTVGPVDQIKGPIEQGLKILKDKKYADSTLKEERRSKIWQLVHDVFDFKAVSMRAVGRHWRNFNEKQKDEFVTVFKQLLKNTYLDQIEGDWSNEQILFKKEDKLSDKKAVVKTVMLKGDVEVPVDYKMFKKDDRWWVYDVNFEGVSLVSNYREQFTEILTDNKPAELIRRLKEKNQKPSAAKSSEIKPDDKTGKKASE